MKRFIQVVVALSAALALPAEGADVTGDWIAKIPAADGVRDYTFAFRQSGGTLLGTVRTQEGVVSISNGSVNYKTIAFVENVTVAGRRIVIEYTGELVSDNEIRFKRQAIAPPYFTVQFDATRIGSP